jgi:dynein heavy chain
MKRLKEEDTDGEKIKLIYEGFFAFAVLWGYGASLDEDKLSFSNGFKSTCTKIKFPDVGMVFDYYSDPLIIAWVHWDQHCPTFNKDYEGLFNNLVVPTAETTRQKFLLDMHVAAKKGMLYVGSAGTGKTTIIKDFFTTLDKDVTANASINFNSYTDTGALQVVLESPIEKRAGRTFGPRPPAKTLVYFMDDLNMPALDKYGTQSPICLIRQIIDYQLVFDREHLEEKKTIQDMMFLGCLNPKSGSFIIDLRLSRHFTLVALGTPDKEILQTIYG